MLQMTNIVELQLQLVEREPRETRGRREIDRRNLGFYLGAADFVELYYFGFGVRCFDLGRRGSLDTKNSVRALSRRENPLRPG